MMGIWSFLSEKWISLKRLTPFSKFLTGPGKKFPQNMRALRLVVEELLRPLFSGVELESYSNLVTHLDDIGRRSRTSKVWIDCLIKAVFIMMVYVRAEREADWPLHLKAVKLMLPYFFATGHVNYARYSVYYLLSMETQFLNVSCKSSM